MIENIFNYRIYKSVYDDMLSGKKTVEFRLLNEKSEKIKPGDKIKFQVVDNESLSLMTKVLDKYIYNDIDELWNDKKILQDNTLDYAKEEFRNTFYEIFGKENVVNSKIVGIKITVLEK